MQNKKILYIIISFVSLACISSFFKMIQAGNDINNDSSISALAYIGITCIGLAYSLNRIETLQNSFVCILLLYSVYFCINYLIINDVSPSYFVLAYQNIWCFIGIIAYSIGRSINIDFINKLANILVYSALPFITYIYLNRTEGYVDIMNSGRDAYFICMILLIWTLSMKSKYRIVAIAILCILCITSLKRSVIVIAIFTILAHLYDFITNKKISQSKKMLLLFSFTIGIIYLINNTFEVSTDVVERFQSIKDDGGSGRDSIYMLLWNNIQNFDSKELIFGRGYSSVYDLIGLQAHNDFLQIIHSIGIIGLAIYILIYICCISKILSLKVTNHVNKNLKLCSAVIIISFAFTGYLNCFIVNPPIVTPFIFLLGIHIGAIDNIIKSNEIHHIRNIY